MPGQAASFPATTPEAARLDLYNGLSDLLGPERADTLMTYLPSFQPDEIATRSDLGALRDEVSEFRADLKAGLTALNLRMDRLFLTLVAGLLTVVAAMAGILLSVA